MQTGLKSLLGDPALTAMGLVPVRDASAAAVAPGYLSWRAAWASLGFGIVFILWLFRDTALHIVNTWYGSATFNHGFLILPICFYLIWLKRGVLARHAPQPFPLGALGILLAAAAWLAGHVASVSVVQQIALVAMIQGLFVTVLGLRIARLLLFPLAYLIFAAPFGEALIGPLQDLTAVLVVALLRALNVPVFHDGIFISIPTGNFLVAEACSGVRFLIATVALGFLFAHLTYRSWWRRAAFMALSVVVPIGANGIRAFGLVLVAYLTNGNVAVGIDHIIYGWMFFAIVTVILLGIGMTFRDRRATDETASGARDPGGAPVAGPRQVLFTGVLALLAAASGPAYAAVIELRPVPPPAGALSTPRPGGGWRLAGLAGDDWSPAFPGADVRLLRTYVKQGREVRLFVAYYSHQRHGNEMIGMRNSIGGAGKWTRKGTSAARTMLAGRPLSVKRVHLVGHGGDRVAYQWYWIGGSLTANDYYGKFLQTRQVLLGADEAAATIVVSCRLNTQENEADPVLRDFIASLPPLESWLVPASGGGR